MGKSRINLLMVAFVALAALAGVGLGWLQSRLEAGKASAPAYSTATQFIPQAQPTLSAAQNALPGFTPQIESSFVRVGQPVPDFTLTDARGEAVSLSDFAGQVVLINFWASWCPPCKDEMPALQAAYENYKAEGFMLLAVNTLYVDTRVEAEAFLEELGLDLPVYYDEDGAVAEDLFGVLGLPTSVWVTRDGNLHAFHVGPLEEADIEAALAELLAGS